MRPDPNLPADLRGLTYGEHLLVWGVRAIVSGRGDCPVVAREFREACAEGAAGAKAALSAFVQQLAVVGRRSVSLCPPGCLGLTRDEQLLLAAFAAAQADEPVRLDAHLAFLVARPAPPSLAAAAISVAEALGRRGHRLRFAEPSARPEPEDARPALMMASA